MAAVVGAVAVPGQVMADLDECLLGIAERDAILRPFRTGQRRLYIVKVELKRVGVLGIGVAVLAPQPCARE